MSKRGFDQIDDPARPPPSRDPRSFAGPILENPQQQRPLIPDTSALKRHNSVIAPNDPAQRRRDSTRRSIAPHPPPGAQAIAAANTVDADWVWGYGQMAECDGHEFWCCGPCQFPAEGRRRCMIHLLPAEDTGRAVNHLRAAHDIHPFAHAPRFAAPLQPRPPFEPPPPQRPTPRRAPPVPRPVNSVVEAGVSASPKQARPSSKTSRSSESDSENDAAGDKAPQEKRRGLDPKDQYRNRIRRLWPTDWVTQLHPNPDMAACNSKHYLGSMAKLAELVRSLPWAGEALRIAFKERTQNPKPGANRNHYMKMDVDRAREFWKDQGMRERCWEEVQRRDSAGERDTDMREEDGEAEIEDPVGLKADEVQMPMVVRVDNQGEMPGQVHVQVPGQILPGI